MFEYILETVGVYDYPCIPHETTGMVGMVIGGNPGLEGQPGIQPPKGSLPNRSKQKSSRSVSVSPKR